MTIPIVTRMVNPPFKLKTNHVLYFFGVVMIIIFFFNLAFDIQLERSLGKLLIPGIVILISLPFFGWKEYYPVSHEVSGKINLSDEGMEISESQFKWEELEKLSVEFNDFKGKRLSYMYNAVGPCLSQGVDNYIRFIHNNNTYQYQILINSEVTFLGFHGTLKRLYLAKTKNNQTIKGSKSLDFDNFTYAEMLRFRKEHDY